MTVIELGEVSSSEPELPAPPEPPLRMRDVRWIGLTAAFLLCLLMVTGGAVPEPRGLRTLWSMPYDSQPFTLAGDRLYLHRAGAAPALEALDAATGKVLWSHPLDRPIEWVHTMVPGIVMLPVLADQADGSSTVQDLIALDAATGRTLWQQRGEPAFGDERGLVMSDWNPAANLITRLRMIRPSDGAELWSLKPAQPISSWTASGGADPNRPEWFATVTDAGHVERRRTSDGSLIGVGTVPWLVTKPDDNSDDYAYLHAAAGVLFSVRLKNSTQTMTAFDVGTMRQIWTWTGDGRGGSFDCGGLLCIGDRPGVQAVDPATGRTVWTSPGWDFARPLDATRMLYQSNRDTNQGVLDARTGKILTTFPPGMMAVDDDRGDVVLLTFTMETPTEMAVYRLVDDRLELRGGMGGSTDQGCQLANSRLVCMMGYSNDHTLVVKAVG